MAGEAPGVGSEGGSSTLGGQWGSWSTQGGWWGRDQQLEGGNREGGSTQRRQWGRGSTRSRWWGSRSCGIGSPGTDEATLQMSCC